MEDTHPEGEIVSRAKEALKIHIMHIIIKYGLREELHKLQKQHEINTERTLRAYITIGTYAVDNAGLQSRIAELERAIAAPPVSDTTDIVTDIVLEENPWWNRLCGYIGRLCVRHD